VPGRPDDEIRAACNALGNPICLTPGQRADLAEAEALPAGNEPEAVIADKG